MLNLNNIVDIEIDGIDTSDCHDFCDAFISSAGWLDTGKDLTETELDELNNGDYSDFVYNQVIERVY